MKTKSKKFKLDFVPIGQDLKQAREAKDITREPHASTSGMTGQPKAVRGQPMG